jgi:hypothetical protein
MKHARTGIVAAVVFGASVISASLPAEQFAVAIVHYPPSVPLGVPIEITVQARNATGEAFWAVGLFKGYPDPDGYLSIFARARSSSQGELAPCVYPGYIDKVVVGKPEQPADWHAEARIPVCLGRADRYAVRAVVAERKAVFTTGSRPGGDQTYQIWHGEVASPEVTIDITEPQGVDREAYDHFGGRPMGAAELLREFPTSTYAAYAIWDKSRGKGAAATDPEIIANSLRRNLDSGGRYIPCPPGGGCDPAHELDRQTPPVQAREWSARWIDIVLKAHPDIWFADELRLGLALDEFAAGKPALGASDLQNLAKNARPDIAEKAGQILAFAKQNGVVK